MKQFQFDFESMETPERSLADATLPTPALENRYDSVKRVFLVYEGSLQDRPCITNTDDAKRLFRATGSSILPTIKNNSLLRALTQNIASSVW